MDAFCIILLTSLFWISVMIVICVKAYGKGIDKGAELASREKLRHDQRRIGLMLSEMDGVDEGNGLVRCMSHGKTQQ